MAKGKSNSRVIAAFQKRVTGMIEGVASKYPPSKVITVAGRSMTQPELLDALNALAAIVNSVASAKTAYETALEVRDAALPAALASLDDMQSGVEADLGAHSTDLLSFSISAPKTRSARTAAQKALSAAKAARTRKARGTMGKRQRRKITLTGESGLVVVSPTGEIQEAVKSAVAPASPNAPASSAK